MKFVVLVFLVILAVHTARSQRRGGQRIDRPPDLPRSSTKKGSRPGGRPLRPNGSFNKNVGPPPPPPPRSGWRGYDFDYFQRKKDPFIPTEFHPPILERPKPDKASRKRPRSRTAEWYKRQKATTTFEPTPPTTYIPTTLPTTTTNPPTEPTSTRAPAQPKVKTVPKANPNPITSHMQKKPKDTVPSKVPNAPIKNTVQTPAKSPPTQQNTIATKQSLANTPPSNSINNIQNTPVNEQPKKQIFAQTFFGGNKIPRPPPLTQQVRTRIAPSVPKQPPRQNSPVVIKQDQPKEVVTTDSPIRYNGKLLSQSKPVAQTKPMPQNIPVPQSKPMPQRKPVPPSKPVFKMNNDVSSVFRRPSDIPAGLKPNVLSRLSTGPVTQPLPSYPERFSQGSFKLPRTDSVRNQQNFVRDASTRQQVPAKLPGKSGQIASSGNVPYSVASAGESGSRTNFNSFGLNSGVRSGFRNNSIGKINSPTSPKVSPVSNVVTRPVLPKQNNQLHDSNNHRVKQQVIASVISQPKGVVRNMAYRSGPAPQTGVTPLTSKRAGISQYMASVNNVDAARINGIQPVVRSGIQQIVDQPNGVSVDNSVSQITQNSKQKRPTIPSNSIPISRSIFPKGSVGQSPNGKEPVISSSTMVRKAQGSTKLPIWTSKRIQLFDNTQFKLPKPVGSKSLQRGSSSKEIRSGMMNSTGGQRGIGPTGIQSLNNPVNRVPAFTSPVYHSPMNTKVNSHQESQNQRRLDTNKANAQQSVTNVEKQTQNMAYTMPTGSSSGLSRINNERNVNMMDKSRSIKKSSGMSGSKMNQRMNSQENLPIQAPSQMKSSNIPTARKQISTRSQVSDSSVNSHQIRQAELQSGPKLTSGTNHQKKNAANAELEMEGKNTGQSRNAMNTLLPKSNKQIVLDKSQHQATPMITKGSLVPPSSSDQARPTTDNTGSVNSNAKTTQQASKQAHSAGQPLKTTAQSRMEKVGKMMLEAFKGFMSKMNGKPTTDLHILENKISAMERSAGIIPKTNPVTHSESRVPKLYTTKGNVRDVSAGKGFNSKRDVQSNTLNKGKSSTSESVESLPPNVQSGLNISSKRDNGATSIGVSAQSSIKDTSNIHRSKEAQGSRSVRVHGAGKLRSQANGSSTIGNKSGRQSSTRSGKARENLQATDVSNADGKSSSASSKQGSGNYIDGSDKYAPVHKIIGAKQNRTALEPGVKWGPPPPSFRRRKMQNENSKTIDTKRGQRRGKRPNKGGRRRNSISGQESENRTPPGYHVPPGGHPAVLSRPTGDKKVSSGNAAKNSKTNTEPVTQTGQTGSNEQPSFATPCTMSPVCGSDGFTYMSSCFLWAGLTVVCPGHCPCPSNTAEPSLMQTSQQGVIKEPVPSGSWSPVQGSFETQPHCDCQATYQPVCSMTGATYENDCVRMCSGEALACNGECPCPSGVTAPNAQPCENHCPATFNPVCSDLDHTFDNNCLRQCSGEAKACDGECPCIHTAVSERGLTMDGSHSYDPNNVNNEPSNQPLSTCECTRWDVDPVCTTSGQTMWFGCEAICLGEEIACSSSCPC